MDEAERMMRLLVLAAALAMPAASQCVMCFRTAQSQNQARARVLNAGILVLAAPPFVILAGFVVYIVRRDRTRETDPDRT